MRRRWIAAPLLALLPCACFANAGSTARSRDPRRTGLSAAGAAGEAAPAPRRTADEPALVRAPGPPSTAEADRAERRRGSVFVGGSFDCRFGDCNTHGARLAGGGRVDCRFGDCNTHGATIRRGDGKRATVDCRFGDCNTHGATVRRSDGKRATVDCRFGDCNKHGATIRRSDGRRTTIDCRFGDCNKHGWTERRSDGRQRRCSCRFGDCNKHGSRCD